MFKPYGATHADSPALNDPTREVAHPVMTPLRRTWISNEGMGRFSRFTRMVCASGASIELYRFVVNNKKSTKMRAARAKIGEEFHYSILQRRVRTSLHCEDHLDNSPRRLLVPRKQSQID